MWKSRDARSCGGCSWTEKTIHFCHQRRSESTAPPQKSPARARAARRRPRRAPGRSSVERRAASTGADGRVAGLRPGGSYRPVPALQRRPRGSSRGRVRTRTKRGRVRPGSASWTPRWLVPPGTTILTSAAWGRRSHSAFRRAGAAAEPNGHRREHADTMLKHHRVRYYPECVDLNDVSTLNDAPPPRSKSRAGGRRKTTLTGDPGDRRPASSWLLCPVSPWTVIR